MRGPAPALQPRLDPRDHARHAGRGYCDRQDLQELDDRDREGRTHRAALGSSPGRSLLSSIAVASYTQTAQMLEQGAEAISAAGAGGYGEPHRQTLIVS